jgi:BirA family biotin operon repressor/biotin-[acetyl-CoA-carboxylase] ligase
MVDDGLRRAVQHLPAGWHGHYLATVASTQDVARQAARGGAPSRSLFVADFQSAGRGRQGRPWVAAPGVALMFSLLLRQTGRVPQPWRSTALCAVAMAEAIEAQSPRLQPAIKWPNDIVLDGRKVAGILAESSSADGEQLSIIIGVGVNVRTTEPELSAIGAPATSLEVAAGAAMDRGQLLAAFVARLDRWLARPVTDLQSAWQARLWGRGQHMRLADVDGEQEVVVVGANLDGALRVRLADGSERTTTTGELIL